jgi:hypothetical protein
MIIAFYSFILKLSEDFFATSSYQLSPVELNPILLVSLVVFVLFWLITNLNNCKKLFNNSALSKLYIKLLNSSSPLASTISDRKFMGAHKNA